jgi:membrane associated rhomboid family serine protease
MLLILPIGDYNPTRRIPLVNYLLLAANLFIFFYLYFIRYECYPQTVYRYGVIPLAFHAEPLRAVANDGYRLFTSLFLHGSLAHLLGNMLFLYIAGDNVEDRVGHLRYLLFYLAAGVIANVVHIVFANPVAWELPTIGASGAIAGLMGAYMVWFPRRRIQFWYLFFFMIGTFTVPAGLAFGLWFLQQLYYGRIEMAGGMTGVAYWAHVGGFAFGAVAALSTRISGRR